MRARGQRHRVDGSGRAGSSQSDAARRRSREEPGSDQRFVALRGFSWIVEPTTGGVVIAIEIPTGAVVAGPFDIPQPRLDALISRVLAAAAPSRPVVH